MLFRSAYCPGKQDVTYTLKYCNHDQFPLKFQTGSCLNGPPSNSCSFAYINTVQFTDPDFTTDLPAGTCRTYTKVVTQNICALNATHPLSQVYTSQIQIEGYIGTSFCRGYVFSRVVYDAAEPDPPSPNPSTKPSLRPSGKPTIVPSKKPTRRPSPKPSKYCKYRNQPQYAYKCK